MTSAQLRKGFAKLGYSLVGKRGEWYVKNYKCDNLVEAKSLLLALRDKTKLGGTIFFDGADWRCNFDK